MRPTTRRTTDRKRLVMDKALGTALAIGLRGHAVPPLPSFRSRQAGMLCGTGDLHHVVGPYEVFPSQPGSNPETQTSRKLHEEPPMVL
mmetsp:Transcript_82192/g.228040  ORF Transcript_82192/g.228040 Transcript_82192/m.228040 type:complete len:88 (+) Transcript_82192:260-523(+)